MITEFVTFNIPKNMSRQQVLEDGKTTIERWQGFPGLIRKVYIHKDEETVMGIYLWESIEDAKKGHDEAWLNKAEAKWGNRPQIEYLDTVMVLDNRHDEILEFPHQN